jgi:hypothetical protein
MSLFLRIPEIDPSEHNIEYVARAARDALEHVEKREPSNWTPKKRGQLDRVWQINKANTWQLFQLSKGFELFSYYGEDSTAAEIVAMIPELLKEIEQKALKKNSGRD